MDNENKKYPTPRGASATAAKRKYNSKTYDRFELSLPKGMKEKIDEVAEVLGYKSRRSFILDIIAEKYEQIMGKEMVLEQPKDNNSKEVKDPDPLAKYLTGTWNDDEPPF